MQYVRIKKVTEPEFDAIVTAAGGERIAAGQTKGVISADYRLGNAIIELKLIEEEGLAKETRRQKVAALFKEQQPDSPTVIVDPKQLPENAARAYYNAVEGPIKTHVKKAAAQLDETRDRMGPQLTRVLAIINNGYSALSEEEFKDVCLKCARNDTSKIDWVIVGGIYYHSDKFDQYFIAPFEAVPISIGASFAAFDRLQAEWGTLVQNCITESMMRIEPLEVGHMPVLDIVFEIDGIRFVKPAEPMPESSFWPGGRKPRENSTGIERCPPVATTFPKLSNEEWASFRHALRGHPALKNDHHEWLQLQQREEEKRKDILKPFVPVSVTLAGFKSWIAAPEKSWSFSDLCEYATDVFQTRIDEVLDGVQKRDEMQVCPPQYLHLVIKEIGDDKANDLATLLYVSEIPGLEREEMIFKNIRLFLEYGLAVAAAHAVKRETDYVLYSLV